LINSYSKCLPPFLKCGILQLLVMWSGMFLSGCTVGPNYKRPDVNSPPVFRNTNTPAETNSLNELPWWSIYKDKTLNDLIRTALVNNYDYRIAVTRVEQFRAIEMQVHSQFLPQIGYNGDAFRGENTFLGNIATTGGSETQNSYTGFLDAAWEVDLWGRIHRLDESALAQFLATEEARRGVEITLISDVATAYFQLLELDKQLEIAKRTKKSFEESLNIFTQRFKGGIASELETSRAQAALSSTAAIIPGLESQIAAKENQINVLLGQNPGPVLRSGSQLEGITPVEIPSGLPSELLERRPDIREAEQLLRSANAQIGVAMGDFFPRIGLTALYGGVSNDLSDITLNHNRTWSIGANLTGPIFEGGRLKGQYLQAQAAWEEAKLRYQQTALKAFQEVSDALILRQKLEEVHDQQTVAVQAYQKAVEVSIKRYIAGNASYFEVLEAQQQLFPAENLLAQIHLSRLLVVVQLYKTLGGGWQST